MDDDDDDDDIFSLFESSYLMKPSILFILYLSINSAYVQLVVGNEN